VYSVVIEVYPVVLAEYDALSSWMYDFVVTVLEYKLLVGSWRSLTSNVETGNDTKSDVKVRGGPWIPVGPVMPVLPCGPVSPVFPVVPVLPVGPVSPVGPVEPV
jgi:hypothetical protein